MGCFGDSGIFMATQIVVSLRLRTLCILLRQIWILLKRGGIFLQLALSFQLLLLLLCQFFLPFFELIVRFGQEKLCLRCIFPFYISKSDTTL